jgi:hypothetical protein
VTMAVSWVCISICKQARSMQGLCRATRSSYKELEIRSHRKRQVSKALGVMELKQAVAVRLPTGTCLSELPLLSSVSLPSYGITRQCSDL